MTTLFYLLGYLAVVGFIALACKKLKGYLEDSPLHVRWELYPVPHEGKKSSYGGSFMEETEWWNKKRHIEHWYDIMGIIREVLLLEATFKHNNKLWFRTYPFHFGLYMLMGGTIIMVICVLLEFCGLNPQGGFMMFVRNVINVVVLGGAFAIVGGGIALIERRKNDPNLKAYTTPEHFLNLGAFVVFGLLTLCAWAFNPCGDGYYGLAHEFIRNMFTFTFAPIHSTFFVLSMLVGFFLMIWIPMTNMQHLILKYFMYHDIRWGDAPTSESEANQKKINEMIGNYHPTWAADHIEGDGSKTWADVATSDGIKK